MIEFRSYGTREGDDLVVFSLNGVLVSMGTCIYLE